MNAADTALSVFLPVFWQVMGKKESEIRLCRRFGGK
jgi:hypothetical protein